MNSGGSKLSELLELADLKSKRAMAEFAAVNAERKRLLSEIRTLDDSIGEVLANAGDPTTMALALAFADQRRVIRAELLTRQAHLEIRYRTALALAQKDEGRKIALRELVDQESCRTISTIKTS